MSSQELIKNTVVGILKAGNKAEDFLGNTLKAFDLSLQQFNVLRILRGRKGKPANLKTVQKRMIHKMSNTTRLIDKLIDKNAFISSQNPQITKIQAIEICVLHCLLKPEI